MRETGLESFESTDARGRARVLPKDGLSPLAGTRTKEGYGRGENDALTNRLAG